MSEQPVALPDGLPRPKPRWRRWLVRIGMTLLAIIVGGAIKFFIDQERVRRRLEEAVAQMDREEPGWRLEQIEAARATVPDDVNSALCIEEVVRLLPRNWRGFEGNDDLLALPANQPLPDPLALRLNEELGRQAAALAATRPLLVRETGRHPFEYARNPFWTTIQHTQDTRPVGNLLRLEAYRRAQDGKPTETLQAVRALVNAGRSVGDEANAISQLVRIAVVGSSFLTTERVLGQGEPDVEALTGFQELLERESRHDSFMIMVKGNASFGHAVCEKIEAGELWLSDLNEPPTPPGWEERVFGFLMVHQLRKQHVALFPVHRRNLEIARLPMPERGRALKQHERTWRSDATPLLKALMPSLVKLEDADRRQHARLHCTIVALAAERFRRQNKSWPDSLDSLAGFVPKECCTDPCSGRPLILKRTPDGLMVYSVGVDEKDDGGKRSENAVPGTDIVFQLWDVASRGRKSTQ